MPKALFVEFEAKAGAEAGITDFLRNALTAAENEPGTRDWYALRFNADHFAIFDTFDGNLDRLKHLAGQTSRSLMVKSMSSLNGIPHISSSELIAAKLPTTEIAPQLALYVPIETRMGQGRDFGEFLLEARNMVDSEPGSLGWYALRMGPNSFAIVDFFADETARQAHLNGAIAKSLEQQVGRYIDAMPEVRLAEVLASKRSGWDAMTSAAQEKHPEQSVRIAPKSA
jgi:quinol monooxygenase YgiN